MMSGWMGVGGGVQRHHASRIHHGNAIKFGAFDGL